MPETWPGGLPNTPLAGTLAVADRDNLLTFETDIPGMTTRRRRYSAMVADYAFSIIYTTAELATLSVFHRSTCKSGALSFTFPDPAVDPPADTTFWWAEPPRPQAMSAPGQWMVQFALVREAQ